MKLTFGLVELTTENEFDGTVATAKFNTFDSEGVESHMVLNLPLDEVGKLGFQLGHAYEVTIKDTGALEAWRLEELAK